MERISNDPTNQNTVLVLDTDGEPLMPTRLANTETWIQRLTTLFPITQVRVETARFDTQCGRTYSMPGVYSLLRRLNSLWRSVLRGQGTLSARIPSNR